MPDPMSIAGGTGPISPVLPASTQAPAPVSKARTPAGASIAVSAGNVGNIGSVGTAPRQAREATIGGQGRPIVTDNGQKARNTQSAQDGKGRPVIGDEGSRATVATEATLEDAVATFKEFLDNVPTDLNFSYDREAGKQIFKIVNPVTKEVVKQFPTDEFLTMVRRLKEFSPDSLGSIKDNGFLIDDRG